MELLIILSLVVLFYAVVILLSEKLLFPYFDARDKQRAEAEAEEQAQALQRKQ
jgi:sensor domain CHASE-containing protein